MNHKKIMAAAVSIAALASLAACGGVKDSGSASGNADVITVGTTDKVTSVDPAGSYDNGSYAVQINVFPFLYAQDYNTSELSRTLLRMTVLGAATALNSPLRSSLA